LIAGGLEYSPNGSLILVSNWILASEKFLPKVVSFDSPF
jgi:hypothetical protein